MKLTIIGDGAFGSFLKELLSNDFTIMNHAPTVILAVPISAYNECASIHRNNGLIVNVCSVQKPSFDIIKKYTDNVLCIHPLFGCRTPIEKRNSILTYKCGNELEKEFLDKFSKISKIITKVWFKNSFNNFEYDDFTPITHDALMADTHVAAVLAARQLRPFIEKAKYIPDELIPNSFRLMREFVKTLDDMPKGTLESIMANPYIE